MQKRDGSMGRPLGGPLLKKVKESRVLLVGAGGIGCELLKNLVCCGFGSLNAATNGTQESSETLTAVAHKAEIVLVDLDTIDLSNLNRQFLFRRHHIKKPKALVAKESASQFNPRVNIDAHHADIFDSRYNVEFFESFDVVFNALDNIAARRHVNKMCLAADVPLIESGTTGFNGQVSAIKRGVTQCYDCVVKQAPKSFPICTIRSTPSQPIHCIVWAKSYLLPELFGESEDSSDMTVTEGDNVEEIAKLKEEAEALKKIRAMMGKGEFATQVFNKVFHDDIERLRSMEEMWQSRKPPESLKFEALTEDSPIVKQGQALSLQDQKVWSLLENISVFCYSLEALSNRLQAGESVIEFDKDDKDTLDFVASAANLRAHIFDIPLHSEWDIKQMAGNIIPAIATSNAMIASLCVFEAFKILRKQAGINTTTSKSMGNSTKSHSNEKGDDVLGGAKEVYLASKIGDKMINVQPLAPPNPTCPVCSPVYARVVLPEGRTSTIQDLVDLLKQHVGYEGLSISVDEALIYDPDLDDNLQKPLAEFGVDGKSNKFMTVMDDSDDPKVDLVLSAKKGAPGAPSGLQLLPEKIELPIKPGQEQELGLNGKTNGTSVVDIEPVPGTKRKREAEDDEVGTMKKKAKAPDEAVHVVEDEGAILIE